MRIGFRASVVSPEGQLLEQFRYRLAAGFWSRFIGFYGVPHGQALLIPGCRCVHGFLLRPMLRVYFLDAFGAVLGIRRSFGGLQIAGRSDCAAILESSYSLRARVGDRIVFDHGGVERKLFGWSLLGKLLNRNQRGRPHGASAVEMMLALPLLLFVVFAVVQIGLLWHAKYAVTHAVMTAARHASVSHGSDASIRDGLVRGLLPIFGRADSLEELPAALLRVNQELIQGKVMGWIRWEILSPTRQSFDDWGEPADRVLAPSALAGEIEIPANPITALAQRRKPRSGTYTIVDALPVGRSSGQTLIDATTLKLYLQVGIPLRMPVAGPLMARSLALWSGCGWSIQAPHDQLGLVDFGVGQTPSLLSSTTACRSLAARNLRGDWEPRWPVNASAMIQMQSNPRRSLMTLRDRATKNP